MGSLGENAAQQCVSPSKKGTYSVPDISKSRKEDYSPEEWVRKPSVSGSIPEVLAQLAAQNLTHPASDVSTWDVNREETNGLENLASQGLSQRCQHPKT